MFCVSRQLLCSVVSNVTRIVWCTGALSSGRVVTHAQSTVLAACSRTKAVIAVTSRPTTPTTASHPGWLTASAAATSRSAPSCVKSTTTASANNSGSVTNNTNRLINGVSE